MVTRCTASKAFPFVPVCFSEKTSKPRSKACALPQDGTAAQKRSASALPERTAQCTRPSATENYSVARQQPTLQRGANESAGGACPAKLVAGRRDAANVLGVRAWWYKWTSDQREMHTLKWEHWVTFTHGLRLNGVARQCGRADTETNLRDRTAGDGLQRDNELGCACLSKGAKCRFA